MDACFILLSNEATIKGWPAKDRHQRKDPFMDEKQKVDGFRSAKEVLREYLGELLYKTEDPTKRNFFHDQIDNLDNQEDRSNSNLLFAVLRQKECKRR